MLRHTVSNMTVHERTPQISLRSKGKQSIYLCSEKLQDILDPNSKIWSLTSKKQVVIESSNGQKKISRE